jgi:hypothetical protein
VSVILSRTTRHAPTLLGGSGRTISSPPSGTTVGDFLLLIVEVTGAGGGGLAATPAGWTVRSIQSYSGDGSGFFKNSGIVVFQRVATGADFPVTIGASFPNPSAPGTFLAATALRLGPNANTGLSSGANATGTIGPNVATPASSGTVPSTAVSMLSVVATGPTYTGVARIGTTVANLQGSTLQPEIGNAYLSKSPLAHTDPPDDPRILIADRAVVAGAPYTVPQWYMSTTGAGGSSARYVSVNIFLGSEWSSPIRRPRTSVGILVARA